jgi:hypothetical protein
MRRNRYKTKEAGVVVKKNIRRYVHRASVVLLVALLVAACGGGGSSGGNPVNPPPSNGLDITPDAFVFSPVSEAAANALVASGAVLITGIEAPAAVQVTGGEYKVDDGSYTTSEGQITNGGRLTARVQASGDAGEKASVLVSVGGVTAVFEVTTQGAVIANKTVPSAQYPSLTALLPSLKPGDVVDVQPLASGQAYGPIKFRASGTAQQPITIRGVRVGGKLPQIKGYNDDVGGAVKFEGAHHMVLDSFEITNGANANTNTDAAARNGALYCLSNQANHVVLRRSKVFDCINHGILGADEGSGTLTLDQVEVFGAGCDQANNMQCESDAIKHPVYVATDPDAFPGSVLRIRNSYLHDNLAGETIKSRAQRAEIYNNWIESKDDQTYKQDRALGLYGYDGATASLSNPIHHDVVGNVIVVVGGSSMARFGGDDTGSSFGRSRFVNNTVLLGESYGQLNASQPVIRLDGDLDAFVAHNNIFHVGGNPGARKLVLVRENSGLQWATGNPKVLLTHNHVPEGSILLRTKAAPPNNSFGFGDTLPSGYAMSDWVRAASPGFENDSTLTSPKLRLLPSSALRASAMLGTRDTNRAPGFNVAGAQLQPLNNPAVVAPGFVQPGSQRSDKDATPVLGSYD